MQQGTAKWNLGFSLCNAFKFNVHTHFAVLTVCTTRWLHHRTAQFGDVYIWTPWEPFPGLLESSKVHPICHTVPVTSVNHSMYSLVVLPSCCFFYLLPFFFLTSLLYLKCMYLNTRTWRLEILTQKWMIWHRILSGWGRLSSSTESQATEMWISESWRFGVGMRLGKVPEDAGAIEDGE